jgi:hypothetical protein
MNFLKILIIFIFISNILTKNQIDEIEIKELYPKTTMELIEKIKNISNHIVSPFISIKNTKESGVGVFANNKISKNTVLYAIPNELIINVDTEFSSITEKNNIDIKEYKHILFILKLISKKQELECLNKNPETIFEYYVKDLERVFFQLTLD